MKRRDFIKLATATALAVPRAAAARDERVRCVAGLLSIDLDDPTAMARMASMKSRLAQLGWVEGRNIRYVMRSSKGDPQLRSTLADELIALAPDVLVSSASPDTTILLARTHTIPVVFSTAADPVGSGFVQSMTRPGGNATGFTNSHSSMGSKWLEILKEIAPGVRRVGVLFNPESAPRKGDYFLDPLKEFAPSFGVELSAVPVADPAEIPACVARFADGGGILVIPDSFVVKHRAAIVAAAAQYRVPAIYPYYYFMTDGGLVSYGFSSDASSPEKSEFIAAEYIDLILRGANPAELPVRSPRVYELLINLKTAKALGLTVPPALLARADKVFE